jgi:uncharacterized repeat protein (TIGR03803 family)
MRFSRCQYTLVTTTIALLAGCGGSQPPIGAPGAIPQNATELANGFSTRPLTDSSFKLLYSFKGGSDGHKDGYMPFGPLIAVNGALYGITSNGGTNGNGTVFQINATGRETVLYSFNGGSDGAYPQSGLIYDKGMLYGTTFFGGSGKCGSAGCGTVYGVSTRGSEKVLYSFTNGADGAYPVARLTVLKGALYGTTEVGGTNNVGAVFKITRSGEETVLHSFANNGTDGAYPAAALISVNGALYGTTKYGGVGNGTVFKITMSGKETVLYGFKGGVDGANPTAALISVNDTFYGTTPYGGNYAYRCHVGSYFAGCGTVFGVSPSGDEHILYRFKDEHDGAHPIAGLAALNGSLYGTASIGGYKRGCGCGTAFQIGTGGLEQTVHIFKPRDGEYPNASLIVWNRMLFGTALDGGDLGCRFQSKLGCGTVFRISP